MLAIGNVKGGVGKTTVTLNLAATAADLGGRVLVIDADPQATATETAGVDPEAQELPSLADALAALSGGQDVVLDDVIVPEVDGWGFDLVPAELRLMRVELSRTPGDELLLSSLVGPVADRYDLILADPPAYLGVLTSGVLRAADGVLLVATPSRGALSALAVYLEVVAQIRRTGTAALPIVGVVANKVAEHEREPKARMAELGEWCARDDSPELLHPTIPRRAGVAEAFGAGMPAVHAPRRYAGVQDAANAYRKLADQLLSIEKVIAHD